MAKDINHVVLVGRLTRDVGGVDFTYTAGGVACANASIAVNRSRKQGEQWVDEVSFFDVTIWGKTAENLRPYLTKGKLIGVDGFLKQDRWEKDGQRFSKIRIVAENVQLLGGRQGDSVAKENANAVPQSQGAAESSPPPDDFPF